MLNFYFLIILTVLTDNIYNMNVFYYYSIIVGCDDCDVCHPAYLLHD